MLAKLLEPANRQVFHKLSARDATLRLAHAVQDHRLAVIIPVGAWAAAARSTGSYGFDTDSTDQCTVWVNAQ